MLPVVVASTEREVLLGPDNLRANAKGGRFQSRSDLRRVDPRRAGQDRNLEPEFVDRSHHPLDSVIIFAQAQRWGTNLLTDQCRICMWSPN
jgi:hypothetical protein